MRWLALLLLGLTACSSSSSTSPDAATSTGTDAGLPADVDAGTPAHGDAGASGSDAGSTAAADAGASDAGSGPAGTYFPAGAPWTQDVSSAPVASDSADVITWLQSKGWGYGHMQIDFSIDALQADESAPFTSFTPNRSFFSPDCDHVPMPLPAGGNVEGESGYACTHGGDCHLLVVHRPSNKLYEMWRADVESTGFNGGCLAVWDLSQVYPASGRGEQCTSADAAGFPIAPLLVTADEVAAGHVEHAIRFVLPNDRIRNGEYLHPATHSTGSTSGPGTAPPYGAHLRLKGDFDMSRLPNDAARTVARAMQKYGILLADGGNVALTFQSDRHTTAKWSTLMDSHALFAIQVSDFELLDAGAPLPYTGDCVRNP